MPNPFTGNKKSISLRQYKSGRVKLSQEPVKSLFEKKGDKESNHLGKKGYKYMKEVYLPEQRRRMQSYRSQIQVYRSRLRDADKKCNAAIQVVKKRELARYKQVYRERRKKDTVQIAIFRKQVWKQVVKQVDKQREFKLRKKFTIPIKIAALIPYLQIENELSAYTIKILLCVSCYEKCYIRDSDMWGIKPLAMKNATEAGYLETFGRADGRYYVLSVRGSAVIGRHLAQIETQLKKFRINGKTSATTRR